MGLDMYLYKRTYFASTERQRLQLLGVPESVEPTKVTYIVEDAGNWRKANAIHRWFVENVQAGNDDCGVYAVSREQLQQLLGHVEAVLAHPDMAATVLPTQPGFFFGATDYDAWYFDDLEETKRILTAALVDEEAEFEYTSSW